MMQETDFEMLMKSPTFREVYERAEKKGIEKGIEKGRRAGIEEMLQRLLMRRLQRELTPDEQAALSSRAATLDSEQATNVLDLPADALKAWLLGPDAE
jgi:predicted transposase YdaD